MQRYDQVDSGAAEWHKARRVLIALSCAAAAMLVALEGLLAG